MPLLPPHIASRTPPRTRPASADHPSRPGPQPAMAESFARMRRHGPRFYFGFSAFANGRSPKTPQARPLPPGPPRPGAWFRLRFGYRGVETDWLRLAARGSTLGPTPACTGTRLNPMLQSPILPYAAVAGTRPRTCTRPRTRQKPLPGPGRGDDRHASRLTRLPRGGRVTRPGFAAPGPADR